jgi:ABC-type antimicrobial peptide transport system permease subunit
MIADAVRRRTAEIGLRVALGARKRAVVALVLKEGLFMTAAGAIAGSAGNVVLAKVVRSFVPSLPFADIVSLGSVSLMLVLVVVGGHPAREPRASHQSHNRASGGMGGAPLS